MGLGEASMHVDRFAHAISTMSNLEDLVISVPESLSRGIGTLFNGPFDLACLKTCSSPTNPSRYRDIDRNRHVILSM